MKLESFPTASGHGIRLTAEHITGANAVVVTAPVTAEFLTTAGAVVRVEGGYDSVERVGAVVEAEAEIRFGGGRYRVRDRWTLDAAAVSVHRHCEPIEPGREPLRLLLEAQLEEAAFDDMQLFAPPALYDLNDINGDGLEDFLDTRDLIYRDDRLTGLTVLAFSPATSLGYALSRDDVPAFDDIPDRISGQQEIVQRTDVGALGLTPAASGTTTLVAAYPFVERSRSHALTSEGREPWGAFWPMGVVDTSVGASFDVVYSLSIVAGAAAVDCLWNLWSDRMRVLSPRAVELTDTLETITRLRVEALLPYYGEGLPTASGAKPAGFVTNNHPQNGVQLENIIQYGFTGQNVLNAHHVLSYAGTLSDPDARAKALKVIDFFVAQASESAHGLTHTLFDLDTGKTANWWSGLVLPLAYADDGEDLRALMGPVYEHMEYAIEPLRHIDGTYLRCMAEEHAALLRAYEAENQRGAAHPEWLATAVAFGEFLLTAQEPDGSWRRAYDFSGAPVTEPAAWFGETELNQKSSTATAVPVLAALYRVTGEDRWLGAARRAEAFTAQHFVADLKFNGGIHDSIYSRAQLVDSESILFAMRASMLVWQLTGESRALQSATDAARILATWIYLWDVPLPPTSTLAGYGFRSTGWSACDTCGAGYIHPYEIHAAPDLLQIAIGAEDPRLAEIAHLVLVGSSETVATETKDWGYARPGLQEEGLLVSWWLIDDPMFAGTGFGGRGKGEGNKTCLPWISAVGIDAYSECVNRFGTADLIGHFEENTARIKSA
ncbi:hypothetical protein G3T36_02635 [Diaminobutyricibacter tongyongensis]|uniref:Uncharacterized protein n=1 Tax=Leifsonia tongyongensis TaxID=1268043 RepID=A0A6L9XU10_9MICO|nr:hypothetical protein [Diaminobutyricibacter tongyongensis]NEN04757.1 hypothetical protein [Diaminobutyricibacter tongyongensis]